MGQAAAIDRSVFRKTCGKFATGITVATVTDVHGAPHGLTVNSFTSVSCEPPLVLICVDYRCTTLAHFRSSSFYGVNILNETQRDISVRFSQRVDNRFDGLKWHRSPNGAPLIEGCLASLECSVSQVIEAGDHAILIAEVTAAEHRDGKPLLYYASSYMSLPE
jgi:flavin reductase (DIM6/NTAB) family NADH-FMN oxidoreductase RutF